MKAQEPVAKKQITDLLYQALETELGGVEIYRMAILCAKNEDLKAEWTKYRAQTERHVEVVRGVFDALGLDPEATTPGRQIVRDKGKALLWMMEAWHLDPAEVIPLYVGDDLTDEDGFKAIEEQEHGIGILVAEESRPTAASYSLRDPDQVRRFLVWLAERR